MSKNKQSHNYQLNCKALIFSILVSIFLVLLKAYGWFATDSVSFLSSLLDSSLDVLISVLNILAVIYAARPADRDHKFGHNSIEDIVGLVQASFIAASGLFLFYEAASRFNNPQIIQEAEIGIKIILLSMLATLAIIIIQTIIAKKTKSLILKADLLHYSTDFVVNGSIIVSLYFASKTDYAFSDPLMACFIGCYILSAAFKIGFRAFDNLMDKELPLVFTEKIIKLIEEEKNIIDYHKLKTRRSGSKKFVQLHIEMSANLNLKEAHDVADNLEKKIEALADNAEAIIHIDPA